jgi:hypothetical protein
MYPRGIINIKGLELTENEEKVFRQIMIKSTKSSGDISGEIDILNSITDWLDYGNEERTGLKLY